MDLKVMPRSNNGHKYIVHIKAELRNYLILVLIHQSRSEEIGDALKENVIKKYCVPEYFNNGSSQHIHVITHELFI